MGAHRKCSRYRTTEYDKGASLYPVLTPAFLKTIINPCVKNNENKNVSYPKRNSECPQDATSAPSETRTQLTGLYFFILTNVATSLILLCFSPHKTQFNTAIYTNWLHGLDMKYREKWFAPGYQGHLTSKQELR